MANMNTKRFYGKAKIVCAGKDFLLPFQRKWIIDDSRLKIAVKARQIGWTWATAYSLVRRKVVKGASGDVWISSRDETQAKLFLEDCRRFAEVLDLGARTFRTPLLEPNRSAYTLQFTNGARIHSLTSSADAQAGKRGDRVLDEFALHPDPRKLYGIAYPGITWGGRLEIFSTHRGSDNYFNTLIKEAQHDGNPKGFSVHRVTLQDALDQGFLYKLQMKLPLDDPRQQMDEADYFNFIRAGCPDEETFMQEYMCVPADDNCAFLSYDLIASCEYAHGEDWERIDVEGRELYVGVDIGREHDLTVIWVMEKLGDVFYTRAIEVLDRETFEAQEAALYGLLEMPQVKRCCIDQTGMGRQFAERAQQRFGKYKVEAINFTSVVKEELAYPVRAAFEGKQLRVPNDVKIRADLRAIKKEITASGNVRFSADRGANGHADRFWALALALHAGGRPSSDGPTASVA
jgi:phage FluMu gp28-like protein